MGLVRSRNTKPEMTVRRLVHGMGFRYRLHGKELPGHPDLVFKGRRKVIFVHGCFWHRHKDCPNTRMPKSRVRFWRKKLESNRKRDIVCKRRLSGMGWKYLVIWECELGNLPKLARGIRSFLGRNR